MSEQVVITFKDLTAEQRTHLFNAEKELSKAGIEFDTGAGCKGRDWFFDWSLKGNVGIEKAKSRKGPLPVTHCTAEQSAGQGPALQPA